MMFERVENIAISKGCCKLTLEVLEGNRVTQSSYSKFGFSDYELDPKMGRALFWQKVLKNTPYVLSAAIPPAHKNHAVKCR